MNKNKAQKAFMWGILGTCVVGFAVIVLVGFLVEDAPFHVGKSGKGTASPAPTGDLVEAEPSTLDQPMAGFKANKCFDSNKLEWISGEDGQVYVNGQPFFVKGVSYIGNDGHAQTFTGLNITTIDDTLNMILQLKFNTIRIPVSLKWALTDPNSLPLPKQTYVGPELKGKTTWEIMDEVIDKAAERGLLVMLDMHNLQEQLPTPLWYDDKYTEKDIMKGWFNLMNKFSNKWNLFALDLKNEPFGTATWGNSNEETDVNKFYERAITAISAKFPEWKGLFLVEGNQVNPETDPEPGSPDDYPFWWGGNFGGAKLYPIEVTDADAENRVVYSPHVYGPDVFNQNYFQGPDYREKLPKVWDAQMGWLVPTLRKAVIIGEWGGTLQGKDIVVQNDLAQWMVDNCIISNVYWAINPDSGDTGGIMGWDWKSYDEKKVALVNSVIADPSAFGIQHGKVCLHYGTFPNDQCKFEKPGAQPPKPVAPPVQEPQPQQPVVEQPPAVAEPQPEAVPEQQQQQPPVVEQQQQPQEPAPVVEEQPAAPVAEENDAPKALQKKPALKKPQPVADEQPAAPAAADADAPKALPALKKPVAAADDDAAAAAPAVNALQPKPKADNDAAAAAPADAPADAAEPAPADAVGALKPKPKDIGAANALEAKKKLAQKKKPAVPAQPGEEAPAEVPDDENNAVAPKAHNQESSQEVEVEPEPGTLRGRLLRAE